MPFAISKRGHKNCTCTIQCYNSIIKHVIIILSNRMGYMYYICIERVKKSRVNTSFHNSPHGVWVEYINPFLARGNFCYFANSFRPRSGLTFCQNCLILWKLMTIDMQEKSTLSSGVRSAMCAASQLPGRGLIPLHLHVNKKSDNNYDIYF